MFVDSHCHLDFPELANDLPAVLEAMRANAVTHALCIGVEMDAWPRVHALALQHANLYASVGVHPDYTDQAEPTVELLVSKSREPKVVAIGETGLDYYRDGAPRPDQARAFAAQIELALDTGKPLVIHTRAAEDDTLRLLEKRAQGARVILHCFSMPERLDECLAHEDWWISFAGNATYPKAVPLREAALRVPLDRLLVETDAPFLSPQAVRGKPNQPANVVHTAKALAVERRIPYAELEAAAERNAVALFGW